MIESIPLLSPSRDASARPARVALVTLGCAKNLVDSEIMAGLMGRGGFTMTGDVNEADLAVVNTCAFIGPSQKESIDRILELATLKREGRLAGLIVAGCLAQRYQAELLAEIPEIDAVVGTGQVEAIVRVAHRVRRAPGSPILEVGPPGTAVDLAAHRAVSTPRHLVLHASSRGPVLARIGEAADVVEGLAPHDLEQRLEVLLGLAREPDDEVRADRDAGQPSAEVLEQALHVRPRDLAAHAAEHGIGHVLEGDVHVPADLFLLFEHPDERFAPGLRVGVVDAHPLHPVDRAERAEELGEPRLAVEIAPV